MNSVNLIGNLTTDVELREFGEEKRLATFGLAAALWPAPLSIERVRNAA